VNVTRVRCQYLAIGDYLLIAEQVLGIDARTLQRMTGLHLAESALAAPAAGFGGVEFYTDFPAKAAVLCARLIRNHPLPDGNKRTAYLCMVEFAERNGYRWRAPAGDNPDGQETVSIMVAVAAGELDEAALAQWVTKRLECADG
jgi:death on curing protein